MYRLNNILLLIVLCAVTSCSHQNSPMGKPLPKLAYGHLTPYTIHGGSVVIQQSFRPTQQMEILEATLPIAPDMLIQQYANKRFVTSGAAPKLVFDIQNAAVRKEADEENLVGFLSGMSEDYYRLNVFITMTPIRTDGHRAAPFTVKLKRELFIPQNASVAEREFRQFELLEKMIIDIDGTVTDIVNNKMTAEYF